MNANLSILIANEVGDDDGSFRAGARLPRQPGDDPPSRPLAQAI
jgi:hypothetical protein